MERPVIHRVYFSPGMFGFGQLASYDYFAHVEKELATRFAARGATLESFVLDVPPTASIRRRAARFAELVARTAGDSDDPIHLVGHSTGGLDARLVASPETHLPVASDTFRWLPRLASVTCMNTPHFGTPLASFFATVSGQRMLYALSALTFIALSLGSPPLAAASAILVGVGRIDRAIGIEVKMFDRAVEGLLRVLDDARSREVRTYLEAIKHDQGAVVQLTPEAMDLFLAGVQDAPDVLYQSTVSSSPVPSVARIAKSVLRPWRAMSHVLFTALHGITSRYDERYPCAPAQVDDPTERRLERAFGRSPGVRANDGVVPLRSQLWGDVVWAGEADHLDVLGHFDDEATGHADWMTSGSGFDRARFATLVDAIFDGMIRATTKA